MALVLRAISEVKIDERLVRYSCTLRLSFEVADSIVIDIDSDLLLQYLCVWVLLRICKIKFLFKEIILITLSSLIQ